MSVIKRMGRTTAGAPGGGRVRTSLAAAAVVSVLGALGACGVQPTGVHLTAGGPVSVDETSPSSTPTAAASGTFPIYLFMLKEKSFGSVLPVVRYADHTLSPNELIDALGNTLESESTDGYQTEVPPSLGDELKPTRQKHAYLVGTSLSSLAQLQVVCTLDLYWQMNQDPDPTIRASTQLQFPDDLHGWDDCSQQPGFALAVTWLKGGTAESGFEGAAAVPSVAPDAKSPKVQAPEKKTPVAPTSSP